MIKLRVERRVPEFFELWPEPPHYGRMPTAAEFATRGHCHAWAQGYRCDRPLHGHVGVHSVYDVPLMWRDA